MLRCSPKQGCRLLSAWMTGPGGDLALDRQAFELGQCGYSAGHIEQVCAVLKALTFGRQHSAGHIEQGCLFCCTFSEAAGCCWQQSQWPEVPILDGF